MRFHAFSAAVDSFDAAALRDFYAPDVIWELGRTTWHGVDEVMAVHEQDVVTETHLAAEIRRVSGDTVVADIVERNTFVSAMGFDSLVHRGIGFVLRGSLIAHIGPVDATPQAPDAFVEALGPFFAWIRQEHPDDWALLVDESGRARYGREGGRTLMRLVKEWTP